MTQIAYLFDRPDPLPPRRRRVQAGADPDRQPAERRCVMDRTLVFRDASMHRLVDRLCRLAPSDASILVTGETGTGKELVARYLHAMSPRRSEPFVAVNCNALPDTLAEAELFGFERGSFTGAQDDRIGWFEAAHGGTLFLDEIGDLSLPLQVKLLRVLQEREITRIGSRRTRPVDIRLVVATHVDLPAAVAAKRFREDLFYRIRVASVAVPALRERHDDILPLARHFIDTYARKLGRPALELAPDAEAALLEHRWPGNVRELENALQHALLVATGPRLEADDLALDPPGWPSPDRHPATSPIESGLASTFVGLLEQRTGHLHAQVNEILLRTAFEFAEQNQVHTAELLGISRNTLRTALGRLGIIGKRRADRAGIGRSRRARHLD